MSQKQLKISKFTEGTILYSPTKKKILCAICFDPKVEDLTCTDSSSNTTYLIEEDMNEYMVIGDALSEENFLAIINMDDTLWDSLLQGLYYRILSTIASPKDLEFAYNNLWAANKDTLIYISTLVSRLNSSTTSFSKEWLDNFTARLHFLLSQYINS